MILNEESCQVVSSMLLDISCALQPWCCPPPQRVRCRETSVSISQPADTIAKGEELDYATIDWHDPWDMNGGSDVTQFASPTCDNHPAPYPDAAFATGAGLPRMRTMTRGFG